MGTVDLFFYVSSPIQFERQLMDDKVLYHVNVPRIENDQINFCNAESEANV